MQDITLIGAGRLGYHLGIAFFEKGLTINQVFSRQAGKAEQLSEQVKASPISNLDQVDSNSSLYILAVSDDAIPEVAAALSQQIPDNKIVVHTSGATPSTLLASYFPKHGVFYPLQTFSRDKQPDFQKIPIGVYSPVATAEDQLFELAGKLSDTPCRMDDQQRAAFHLSAVFVNNFTNYLFHIGHELTESRGLSFDLLRPLIEETVEKIKVHPPRDMQTGPARRGDQATITRHLKQLKGQPGFKALYELLSLQILELYKKD